MAAVKTKKAESGPRIETRFSPVPCYACDKPIVELKQAQNVLRIFSRNGRRRGRYAWAHRACLGGGR